MDQNLLRTNQVLKPLKFQFSRLNLIVIALLIAFVSIEGSGCKARKIAAEKKRQEAVKINTAKNTITTLLNDNTKSVDEKEKILNDIKSQNLNDPQLNSLIQQMEVKIKNEKEEIRKKKELDDQKKLEEEERKRKEEAEKNKVVADINSLLLGVFTEIAASSKATDYATANAKISETLKLFVNEDAPVLIIISKSGNVKDYDEPTTIKKYLNYLKDRKESKHKVESVVYDALGRISELEIIKK